MSRMLQAIAGIAFLFMLAACSGSGSGYGVTGGTAESPPTDLPPPATANPTAAGYFVQSGKVFDASGQEIQIRGINHFGFNS
ncbi:MAG: hypothetical protein WBO23_06825, partial [Burkholderiales bacterium]